MSCLCQDRFLDSLHAQHMEAHREIVAENGVDTNSIPAPDLCIVGDWLGPVGEGLATLRNIP